MKRFLKVLRIVLIGIVWSALYGTVIVSVTRKFSGFDLLNPTHYMALWYRFSNNTWAVDSFGRFILFLVVVAFIPVWVIGWIMAVKKWPWIHGHSFRHASPAKAVTQLTAQRPVFTPQKMRLQNSGLLNMSLEEARAKQNQKQDAKASSASARVQDDSADISEISNLARNYPAEVFTNLMFDGQSLPMAISTDEQAILIKLVNYENNTWSVDLNTGIEQSCWFSEERKLDAPAASFSSIVNTLKQNEPECVIYPTFVLTKGKLLNAQETVAFYRENGFRIVTLKEQEIPDVPSLKELFDEVFLKKTLSPEQENPAVNKTDDSQEDISSQEVSPSASASMEENGPSSPILPS